MPDHTLIISDTSPLYFLEQIDQLGLLPKLYGEIIVPQAVVQELSAGAALGERVPDVKTLDWLTIRRTKIVPSLERYQDLGKGELEAISLDHSAAS